MSPNAHQRAAVTQRELSAHAKNLYRKGSWFWRKVQGLRPSICPFDRLLIHVPRGVSVLDAGCGSGLFLGLIGCVDGQASGVGLDLSDSAIEMACQMAECLACSTPNVGLQFQVVDVTAKWPVGLFDVVCLIDVLHHVNSGSQSEVFRTAVSHLKRGGVLLYKDMCDSPFWLAIPNRIHDLLLARQWIHYVPVEQVEAWAANLGLSLVHREQVRRYWYGHELRVFRC
jgi:2-polyprenyl-3-methyl-5-hydroxy-6-metoxy-1,4-benzoquinol methylase